MSNVFSIATVPKLLARFATLLTKLDVVGIAMTWDRGRQTLGLKGPQGKLRLEARAALYPSRALIGWISEQERSKTIVVSPHIPDALASDLRRAGLNHADLNGRLFIQCPWLLLDREPKEIIHRNPSSEPDLFSGRSSRLVRLLLLRGNQGWTQDALVERTGLSRGLVSRLLDSLVRQGLVGREERGHRVPVLFHAADFDGLLNRWREADSWPKRVRVQPFSVLADDIFAIARLAHEGLPPEDHCFTQWFAAWLRHPYTTPPVVTAYVRSEELIHLFQARQVDRGGNLWLVAPKNDEVFFNTQEVKGYRLASDVQIYLDLIGQSQRGAEAAEELRNWEGFSKE